MRTLLLTLSLLLLCRPAPAESLLPPDHDPKLAADRVLERLVVVTAPQVRGAHDAEMALVGDRAYVVAEVNDLRPGESAGWPEIYVAMSVVNLHTLAVEQVIPVARSGQEFAGTTLPTGACFVPRILQINDNTLRCWFASEAPGKRQAQVWYRDFDLDRNQFEADIHRAKLRTAAGIVEMQPRFFHEDAVREGFRHPARDYGLYVFDSFKVFDGRTYVTLNNYPGAQNALAVLNDRCDTFEILGHFNRPFDRRLTESSVNRLPDGTWMAICRQEAGNRNYLFTTSEDGRSWTPAVERPFVHNGTSSKPTFDRVGGIYYLGWQEKTRIDGVNRSVFNVDVSRDGTTWERKYRFETTRSFQYPSFHEHRGQIWVCVTQGDQHPSRKERIMFGRLETLP